jgi:hypothetical protein
MTKQEREEWVARGHKDPYTAFREHIKSATARGIPFRMSFEQWWELWEPHYEKRGRSTGQMCMCRHLDAGAYEVGNVRIDYNRSNKAEAGLVHRIGRAQATACKTQGEFRLKPPTSGSWLWRQNVFDPYEETLDEEEF